MIKTTVYLHSTKEGMEDHGKQLGLTGEALKNFRYTCYEVELELEVDETSGESTIIAVDGVPLAKESE